jgi:hypothetical protein
MTRLCKLGQTVLCLLFLTGCSSGRVVTQYRVVRVEVPQSLFVEQTVPLWQGGTNSTLAKHTASLRDALGQCNADKAAIRALYAKEQARD